MTMTVKEITACLDELGWNRTVLTNAARVNERTAGRWIAGQMTVPPDIAAWLRTLAAFHKANPPPPPPELARQGAALTI